ncbi:MAG TPA: alpha-amylase family glycosyl hydrolase [Kiritimatiellia bacterium]|nr:alpha-amylase family glycosyl hydrolase [Kiritimatiellia bacterium]
MLIQPRNCRLCLIILLLSICGPCPGFSDSSPLGVTASGSGVEIRVWAPEAESVELIGDFNGWRARPRDALRKLPGAGIWSLNLPTRPRGAYRFLINGTLERRDPYGRMVSPDERSSVFYDPEAYRWRSRPPAPFPLDDLVIYELHIGTFHDPNPRNRQPATFTDAIARLDYLAELGINVICLLPVNEFKGRHSWGYNPSDLFAVEQAYGGPDGLKAFIDAAHQRGLSVHLDIVHNHYGPENLDLLHFDGGARRYFYEGDSGIAITPWGPRVNFADPMVRRFVRDNVMFWIDEYRMDGFRWDSTVNIRAWDDGRQPIPEGQAMLDDIHLELQRLHPRVISIAEDSLDIGPFHASWQYDFHHAVMPVLAAPSDADRSISRLADALYHRTRMPRVIYTDNHDEAGQLNRQTRIVNDIDPQNPTSDKARRLSGLASVITLTAPGIPLLFMGNEFLETGPFHDDRPLDWTKARRNAGHVRLHRDLIRLRRNLDGRSPALRGHGLDILTAYSQPNLLAYTRWNDTAPADLILVAMNLSSQTLSGATINLPHGGTWRPVFHSDAAEYGGTTRGNREPLVSATPPRPTSLPEIPPYSALIYHQRVADASPRSAPSTPPPQSARPPFTLHAAIHLIAHRSGQPADPLPMTLIADNQWRFRGPVFWDTGDTLLLEASPMNVRWGSPGTYFLPTSLTRGAPPFPLPEPWTGDVEILFDEKTLAIQLQPTTTPEPITALRDWKTLQGSVIRATLISADPQAVILERPNGRRIRLPLDQLDPQEVKALQSQRHTP